jgi:hypothetical protein
MGRRACKEAGDAAAAVGTRGFLTDGDCEERCQQWMRGKKEHFNQGNQDSLTNGVMMQRKPGTCRRDTDSSAGARGRCTPCDACACTAAAALLHLWRTAADKY